MLFSARLAARPKGAATVRPAEIAARLRMNSRREENPSRSGPVGMRFHWIFGFSLHKNHSGLPFGVLK